VHIVYKQFYFWQNFVAVSVKFGQSIYNVREATGFVQIEVVLSNPSSYEISLQIRNFDVSATSQGIY